MKEDSILAAQEESLLSFQGNTEGGSELVDAEQEEEPNEEEIEALLQHVDGMGVDGEEDMAISEQDGSKDDTALLQWDNKFDGPLHVVCPPGQGMYAVKSKHDSKKKDRIYSWYCKKVSLNVQQYFFIIIVNISRFTRWPRRAMIVV